MRKTFILMTLLLASVSVPRESTAQLYVYENQEGREIVSKTLRDGLRLVEIIEPAPNAKPRRRKLPLARAKPYLQLALTHAHASGLEPALVLGVIEAESHFNPHAVSRAGAVGMMQLMPVHWPKLKDKNPYDPDENVRVGCAYLAKLLRVHKGDLHRALAAYNAGSGTVRRVGGPPKFTLDYVSRILRARVRWRRYLNAPQRRLAPSKLGRWLTAP